MNSYLFFVYGDFQDHDDVQFFTMNILGESKHVQSVRYIVEDTNKNIIVIFDSETDRKTIYEMLVELVSHLEMVKFYFLFDLKDLLAAKISEDVKDLIFKPKTSLPSDNGFEILTPKMSLNDILEKIGNTGIESLTPLEKKFLDNFEN